MQFVIIGQQGSDAGYWVWDGHGFHHVGGWGVDQLAEVSAAINIMREATRLKAPGLAESAARTVGEFVTKQLAAHVGEIGKQGGTVVVVG